MTDVAAERLANCKQLQRVSFACCGFLTSAASVYLARCPRLTSLNLDGCEDHTDAVWF